MAGGLVGEALRETQAGVKPLQLVKIVYTLLGGCVELGEKGGFIA
jgi:hypothetical protein